MPLLHHYFTREAIVIPKLYSIGYASDVSVTRYGPARRDQYLIHYVVSGRGVFNGNSLGRGEGFIITPGMHEHYYPDAAEPWTYLWIISYDPATEGFIEMHNADKGIFKFQNVHIIEDIIKRLSLRENEFAFSNTEITEMYLSIFNNCVYSGNGGKAKTTNAKMYFDYSVSYFSANLHLGISVGDICKKLGVSQPYLYKVFRDEIGCSPKQYICQCRLAQAKKQLSETDFSISEIALSVGYPNVLEFSKFFSSKTELSPTEFRKRTKEQLKQ